MASNLNYADSPVAVRDTAAQEVLRLAESVAAQAERANNLLAERLASVTSQPKEPGNNVTEVEREFPPLFAELRHHLQRIANALNGIEDTTHRTEL